MFIEQPRYNFEYLVIVLNFFQIEWIQQQSPKSRKKRDYLTNDENFNSNLNNDNNIYYDESSSMKFNDPMWSKLWYIVSRFSLLVLIGLT